VTSYLAIEPGVRPSNEGLDWGGGGRGSGIGLGEGFGSGSGRLGGGRGSPVVDKEAWLEEQLRASLKACAPTAKGASVVLESTLDEVVDVKQVELAPARDAKAESCVSEELWKLDLPSGTFDVAFESRAVTVKL
jgi:hypothetical protein